MVDYSDVYEPKTELHVDDIDWETGYTEPGFSPLDTSQLVDLVMGFVKLFNSQKPHEIELYNYQEIFLRRSIHSVLIQDGATITGLWSRQSGKSESLSCLVNSLCIFLPVLARQWPLDPRLRPFLAGIKIGIFAPKDKQSKIIYDRVRSRAVSYGVQPIYSDPDIQVSVIVARADQVAWSNGSMVRSSTASDLSNAEGDTYHVLILDEAQLISKQKEEKELQPFLASTNGSTIKIGTVGYSRGAFSDSIQRNVDVEAAGGVRNHFEFDYEIVIKQRQEAFVRTGNRYHLNYAKFVEKSIKELPGGKENPAFRMNFRLLWQELESAAIDGVVFGLAADDSREAGDVSPYRGRYRYVAGIDFARKRDMTVAVVIEVDLASEMAMRRGEESEFRSVQDLETVRPLKRIVAWGEFPGKKWRPIVMSLVDFLGPLEVTTIVGDATGVGDPVLEMVDERMDGCDVHPFIFGNATSDPLFREYILEYEAGRLTYPAGEQTVVSEEFGTFVKQHTRLQKERKKTHWTFAAPEGEHDDWCDAAALAVRAAHTPAGAAEVEQGDNPFYGEGRASGSSRADRYRTGRRLRICLSSRRRISRAFGPKATTGSSSARWSR